MKASMMMIIMEMTVRIRLTIAITTTITITIINDKTNNDHNRPTTTTTTIITTTTYRQRSNPKLRLSVVLEEDIRIINHDCIIQHWKRIFASYITIASSTARTTAPPLRT